MRASRLSSRTLTRLFAIGAVVTLLVLPAGGTPVSDTAQRLGVAHWLLTGSPPLDGVRTNAPWVLHDRHGRPTPWYGIGQSLVLMPADAMVTAAGARTPRLRFLAVEYLAFPVINGLLVAAAGALLAALGFAPYAAAAGAIALTFCSTLLWHFQNNQENPLQFLLVIVALIGVLRWTESGSRAWLVATGLCLGLDLLLRLPNIVDVAVVSSVPLLLTRDRAKYLRDWGLCAAPGIAAGMAVDRIYHFARFGEWTSNYMQMFGDLARQLELPVPAGFPLSNDFWVGIVGPFISLQASVFLFDPLLVVAAIAVVVWWKPLRPPVRLTAFAAAAGMLIVATGYARYYNWSGLASWGNRFLTTWVWMACLLAVPILLELNVRRRVIAALAALAMSLQLCSLVFPAWLEEVQLGMQVPIRAGVISVPDGRLDHFVIGQRVRNIVATASGASTFHPPILPVVMPLRSLPPWMAVLARLGWCACAIWLAWFSRKLLRSLDPAPSPSRA
ncbi:MAG: hypothetical protein M3Q55_08805 [Acidobacteriota bacterium]|nr:hypothetical protein [Acidobacteriota bacterium]